MASETGDPWLLTPGPLTTAAETKGAMLHDWGSRDAAFIAMNVHMRERLAGIVHGEKTHVCVPLQGSGTFAVEAMIGTLVPRDGKALVLVNGAYGQRMARILEVLGRPCTILENPEDIPCDPVSLDAVLAADPTVTHVLAVHCETTSGVLNPIAALAEATARHHRRLLIDAMSAFGALELDARAVPFDAVAASSNKCLEGVPGMGFVVARRDVLEAAAGNAHSLALDLHDQWRAMEGNGQWRFTPPTHVIAAFSQALDRFEAEGGVAGRHARYAANCRLLVEGMRALGFATLLPDAVQAPIIVTFRMPADPKFHFPKFYDGLKDRGFVIYPGKLTVADSFRMGCIGALGAAEMKAALGAVAEVMKDLGVVSGQP
ncbi:MAG: 2-aminoethylphosphonate--pyruvate transaminase [Magnetospirillum sp. WYHS-4]